jgi:hypothetical protein
MHDVFGVYLIMETVKFVRIETSSQTAPYVDTFSMYLRLLLLDQDGRYATTIFDFQGLLSSIDFNELQTAYEDRLSTIQQEVADLEETLKDAEQYNKSHVISRRDSRKKELEKVNIILEIIRLGKKHNELQ